MTSETSSLPTWRRRWACAAWAFGSALALTAEVRSAPTVRPAPPAPLTLAIGDLPHYAPLLMAEHDDLFRAEGLTLKIIHCINGKRCLQHLLDGEVQVAAAADLPIAIAAVAGRRFDIVATLGTAAQESRLVARLDRGIRVPADLRGKRIGFVRGTTGQYYTDTYLLFHGIEAGSITKVALDPADAVAALQRGDVDAAGLYQPQASSALQQLGQNGRALPGPRLYTATINLVSQTAAAGVSDDDLRRLLRALQKAVRSMQQNPDRAKGILAARLRLEPQLFNAVFDVFDFKVGLQQPLIDILEAQTRWAKREGLAMGQGVPDFLQMMRLEPLKEVDARAVGVAK